jgi:hypothetical protein
MKTLSYVLLACLVLGGSSLMANETQAPPGEQRTWIDKKGRKISARLAELWSEAAVFVNDEGNAVSVRIKDLSPRDIEYLEGLRHLESLTVDGKEYTSVRYNGINDVGQIIIAHSYGVINVPKSVLAHDIRKRWALPDDQKLGEIRSRGQARRDKARRVAAVKQERKELLEHIESQKMFVRVRVVKVVHDGLCVVEFVLATIGGYEPINEGTYDALEMDTTRIFDESMFVANVIPNGSFRYRGGKIPKWLVVELDLEHSYMGSEESLKPVD